MREYYWILWFIVITFSADRGVSFLAKKTLDSNSFLLTEIFKSAPKRDILMLGNSRIFSLDKRFIEAKTGNTIFQIGYNGLPADLAEVLIKDYFSNHPPPNKLVIDISLCDRINEGLIRQFSPFMERSEGLESLIRDTDPNLHFWMRMFHSIRFNSEVFYRSLARDQQKSGVNYMADRIISKDAIERIQNLDSWTWSVHPKMLDALIDIIEYAETQGVQVILMISPVLPHMKGKLTNLDTMVEQIETRTSLPVHDFLFTFKSDTLFSDNLHVNQVGSEKFTQLFLDAGLLD